MIRQLFTVVGRADHRVLRLMLASLCAAAVLEGVAFALLVPLLEALLGDDPGQAWGWLWALSAAALTYGVAHTVSLLNGFEAGATLARGLHRRIGDHVASLPLGWFGPERIGQLGQLTTHGVIEIMGVPAHLLRPLVNSVLTPATVVVAMYLFDWRLALAATLTVPVIVLVHRWCTGLMAGADADRARTQAETAGRVVEFAQLQPVLRAFGRGGHDRLDEALAQQHTASRRMLVVGVPGLIGFSLVVQAAFTVILVSGTKLALGGSLGVPQLLALLVLAARFAEPIAESATLGSSLRMAGNSLRRMEELLAVPTLPEPVAPRPPVGAGIELDAVTFGYDGDPVLRGVSFTVPERTMTALVGPSGSGKTTVTRLIGRFWDVDAGSVRLGGVDVREVATEDLMANISMVFQDVYLFEGTIEDNIRVGRPGASEQEIRRAARLAQVEEIVARLPDGWQTQVGEGGARLSGGERQRVSIARALLKDAPVVLLDEATASLDPESERAVQRALEALTADRTLLVIAHRLPTVAAADQVLVLEDGAIAARGTHEELMAHGGRYAAFWAERGRAGQWRVASRPGAVPAPQVLEAGPAGP